MRMPVRADLRGDGLGNRDGVRGALGGGAAVFVVADVGVLAQEGVQEVTVRGVELDAVEPGVHRAARRGDELAPGALELLDRGFRRRGVGQVVALGVAGVAVVGDGAGRLHG